MKLTWFADTTLRIHIGGEILVCDAEKAPAFVDRRELVSGADRLFTLSPDDSALPVADPVKWRPRAAPKFVDEPTTALEVIVSRIGTGAVLIDAIGESPLLLLASAPPPRLGRWLNDAVVVLFGRGEAIVAAGSELLEMAQPRLLVLASDETSVDRAIADLRGHLEGTALVALEPALALEV
jgi:hypothetical protein